MLLRYVCDVERRACATCGVLRVWCYDKKCYEKSQHFVWIGNLKFPKIWKSWTFVGGTENLKIFDTFWKNKSENLKTKLWNSKNPRIWKFSKFLKKISKSENVKNLEHFEKKSQNRKSYIYFFKIGNPFFFHRAKYYLSRFWGKCILITHSCSFAFLWFLCVWMCGCTWICVCA